MIKKTEIPVHGMHCTSCGLTIDEAVESLDGVARAATDVRGGHTRVDYDPERVDLHAIAGAISEAGYQAQLPPPPHG